MTTCKNCGKEIDYTNKTKLCERCASMTPEQRRKTRPGRFAFILYIADILLILTGAAVAVLPMLMK